MTGKEIVDHKGLKALGIRYCKVHLRRMEKAGQFPRAFKLGDYPSSPLVWWLCEVFEWLDARAATRLPTALK